MARADAAEKRQDSGLTEVWIGLGFLGLVVIGVVGVFGSELKGLFLDEPPPALTAKKGATANTAPKQGSSTTGTAPSAPAPTK